MTTPKCKRTLQEVFLTKPASETLAHPHTFHTSPWREEFLEPLELRVSVTIERQTVP
jgi:hypothetical protein